LQRRTKLRCTRASSQPSETLRRHVSGSPDSARTGATPPLYLYCDARRMLLTVHLACRQSRSCPRPRVVGVCLAAAKTTMRLRQPCSPRRPRLSRTRTCV
jgi:hypothetical protein